MLVKNRGLDNNILNSKTIYLDSCNDSFIILDDGSYEKKKHIEDIKKYIEEYDYDVINIPIEELMDKVKEYIQNKNIDLNNYTVLTIGEGGKRALDAFSENLDSINIVWSRKWEENGKSDYFYTNIDEFDFKNTKDIIIFEDVIASGETVYNIVEEIKKRQGNPKMIISAIINEESPIIEKNFLDTIVALKICNDSGKDPFWFPAVYSTRHLFWGDNEMPDFYKILNEKYFGNDSKIEKKIKELRGG